MSALGIHVNLHDMASVIFALAALVTAWKGQKGIKRKAMEDTNAKE